MATVTGLLVAWITEAPDHGLALITGKPANVLEDVVWETTTTEPSWSKSKRGWVILLDELPDVWCALESRRAVVRKLPPYRDPNREGSSP